MHFSRRQKILFRHCDPAGIVFYPRYFEMLNDAVEAMFEDLLHWPFETLHADRAVPTAAIETRFRAPSRHGDRIYLDLTIQSLGRSSMNIETVARAGAETRFEAQQTLVLVGADGHPQSWPERIRRKITDIMKGSK